MAALAAALPAFGLLEASGQAAPKQPAAGAAPAAGSRSASVAATGPIQLRVRRLDNSVELLVQGVGAGPQLQQSSRPDGWQGQLTTASPSGLRSGPQRLSLPELGFQSISLDGAGRTYNLSVTPIPGVPMARPVVSADGMNLMLTFPFAPQGSLQTSRFDLGQPGAVPLPTYAPPLQPRAVAPPLGDMAVGTMMLRNPGYVNVSGPPVTMTLKNAPAKDALMALAQLGGYGFVFVDDGNTTGQGAGVGSLRTVSISFRGETYSRALNSTLLAAGLQGKKEGNMIIAGPNALAKSFGAQMSKVYRLNQVGPNAAADYLANLGATVTKTNTLTTATTTGVAQNQAVSGGPNAQTTQTANITTVEAYGATAGPLIGLRATTDTRLGTITLIGDPNIVLTAEGYLRQLDLRQRQVALSVRILDVSLDNAEDISNSFAIRWGNNFIVNDGGQLLGAFGNNMPPGAGAFNRLTGLKTTVQSSTSAIDNAVNATRDAASSFNNLTGTFTDSTADTTSTGSSSSTSGSNSDSSQTLTTKPNPGLAYPNNNFYDFLRAQIVSGSTKLLASPTLILQENSAELREGGGASSSSQEGGGLDQYSIDAPIGRRKANEGVVRVGTNVPTQVEVVQNSQAGTTSCNISELTTAGLVLGARIEKIDDNGFVTFALSPSVSAVTDQEPAGSNCPAINILSVRRLDTGAVRVRDGQTLILTGVISDFDRSEVTKWPVLGDIPLIGQFFRGSSGRREKRELVIMVTPKIINDEAGGTYGYGYQPSTPQARDFMGGRTY